MMLKLSIPESAFTCFIVANSLQPGCLTCTCQLPRTRLDRRDRIAHQKRIRCDRTSSRCSYTGRRAFACCERVYERILQESSKDRANFGEFASFPICVVESPGRFDRGHGWLLYQSECSIVAGACYADDCAGTRARTRPQAKARPRHTSDLPR